MADTIEAIEVMAEEPNVTDSQESGEFEVLKITSRKEAPDGLEHLYEVHWKDGDITYEPVSNLSGASDALRIFLEEHYPNDALLKVLSSLAQSDDEAENGADRANGVNDNKQMSWLARWHQKTTRGSTQYWLRKGDSREGTPERLPRGNQDQLNLEQDDADDAPLAPLSVPDSAADVSAVLFSEGEDTPGGSPGKRVRKRIRVVEETVKLFPHEELHGIELERSQSKTLALWREILSGVLLVIPLAIFIFLYYSRQNNLPKAET